MFPTNSLKFLLVGAAALAAISSARPIDTTKDIVLPGLPISLSDLPTIIDADININVVPHVDAEIELLDAKRRDCPLCPGLHPTEPESPEPTPQEPTTPEEPIPEQPTPEETSPEEPEVPEQPTPSVPEETPELPEEPTPEVPEPEQPTPEEPEAPITVPTILIQVSADLGPLLGEIKTCVQGIDGANVALDVELLNTLLGKVIGVLNGALGDITTCIETLPLKEALGLGGSLIGALDLCGVLAGLLNTVFIVLMTVGSAVKGLDDAIRLTGTLNGVVATAAQLLVTVIAAVPAVQGLLAPIVQTILTVLSSVGLDLSPLTKVLGL